MKFQPPNYTQVPNAIFDMMPQMKDAETKITFAIIRQTFGWHREKAKLSVSRLMSITGLSKQGVLNGIEDAIRRGTIVKLPDGDSFTYQLLVNEVDPPLVNEVDPYKERLPKKPLEVKKTKNPPNQPVVSSLIVAERLVGFSSEQQQPVQELEQPEREQQEQQRLVGLNPEQQQPVDILAAHQPPESGPPVKAMPLPPDSENPPPPVAEAEQSYALLTDDEIGMSRAKAAAYANLYDFPWLVAQVATWWCQRADGKKVDGKPVGVGLLCLRLEMEWAPDPIRDDFRRSELYRRHYPLSADEASEWDYWQRYGGQGIIGMAESPPAWLDELLGWERAIIEALPAPLGRFDVTD